MGNSRESESEAKRRDELESMRDDWNRRASQDAWYAIDTMTQHGDMASFYSRSAELVPVLCDPVIELLGIQAENEIVLEIGCGIGRLFPGMSQRFREVWGIDISAVMVAEGEKTVPLRRDGLSGTVQRSRESVIQLLDMSSRSRCFNMSRVFRLLSRIFARSFGCSGPEARFRFKCGAGVTQSVKINSENFRGRFELLPRSCSPTPAD